MLSQTILTLPPGDLFDMLLPLLIVYQDFVRNHATSLEVGGARGGRTRGGDTRGGPVVLGVVVLGVVVLGVGH